MTTITEWTVQVTLGPQPPSVRPGEGDALTPDELTARYQDAHLAAADLDRLPPELPEVAP